jgi:hypothetical protein
MYGRGLCEGTVIFFIIYTDMLYSCRDVSLSYILRVRSCCLPRTVRSCAKLLTDAHVARIVCSRVRFIYESRSFVPIVPCSFCSSLIVVFLNSSPGIRGCNTR